MIHGPEVRIARNSDREFVRFELANGSDVSGRLRERFDEPGTTTYVAVVGDRVVGQVMVDVPPVAPDACDARRFLRLFGLFVQADQRRRGIATLLMDCTERHDDDVDGVLLLVESGLSEVRQWYERRGYVPYAQTETTSITDTGADVTYKSDAMCLHRVRKLAC